MIYLFVFFLSVFLIYISESKKIKHKNFVIFLALLLPCVLAGLRDVSIGTDVSWYVKKIFDASHFASSFSDYMNTIILNNPALGILYRVSSHEIGFVLFEFIIQNIFDNFQVLLFFLEVLIVFPVYFGIKKIEYIQNNKLIWLSMLLYYLLLYNAGLNTVRQFVAISFLFYGFCSFISKDKKYLRKVIISFLIALSFHNSSWIALIYYIGYYLINKKIVFVYDKKRVMWSSVFLACILMGGLALFYIPGLMTKVLSLFNIGGRYALYFRGDFSISGGFIFCIPIILFFIYNKETFKTESNNLYYLFIYFYIIYMLCIQLSTGESVNSSRISWYFQIFNIISLPHLFYKIKQSDKKSIGIVILIILCLIYWFYKIVYRGYYDTYPYIWFF